MTANQLTDNRNIVLIGYRGAGKTTVGRIVAARLNRSFIDTDQLIETQTGRTIADIFATDGEPTFRQNERDTIAEVTRSTNQVIAVGGGAIMDPRNRANLTNTGWIVYLAAPPEHLWQRIQSDPSTPRTRPNLTPTGGLHEIQITLAQRDPVYRQSAAAIIETLNRSPANSAESLINAFQSSSS